MIKIEAALHVLFARNLDELDIEADRYDLAAALGIHIEHTNQWSELRDAAKVALLTHLTANPGPSSR